MKSGRVWAATIVVAGLVSAAPASATLITSRAALGGNDVLDWATVGQSLFILDDPFDITTTGGLLATVRGSGFGFVRDGFAGNFSPGDALLMTRGGDFCGNCGVQRMSIEFAAGISAFGAQIQDIGYDSPFLGMISVFDSLDNLLESYSVPGFSLSIADNSAPFVGVSRSTADIKRIEFGTNSGRPFVVNRADLLGGRSPPTEPPVTSVPEPSSLAVFGLGFALLGLTFVGRRRSNTH
jgi:hypothetical protein